MMIMATQEITRQQTFRLVELDVTLMGQPLYLRVAAGLDNNALESLQQQASDYMKQLIFTDL